MDCVERYKQWIEEDLDKIILEIKTGRIKAGRYAHRVKIDKKFKIKGKELFSDERRGKH